MRGFPILVLLVLAHVFDCSAQQQEKVAPIVSKAIDYVAKQQTIAEQAGSIDSQSLYAIAKEWQDSGKDKDAWDLYRYLADNLNHVPSMAKMGHHHADKGQKDAALEYFKRAGEEGPHHASLYNAGRILAEQHDWVGALVFLRAGASLHQTHPSYAQESNTKVSREAYEIVSQQVAHAGISLKESADAFMFGSPEKLPEKVEILWTDAILSVIHFNETLTSTTLVDHAALVKAVDALQKILSLHSSKLSPLQTFLVLKIMNGSITPLVGLSKDYLKMAAAYSEALASSQYCFEQYATSVQEASCFNDAAARAMSYYRRLDDQESAERVFSLAKSHPEAATHWDSMQQTPPVYYPQVSSKVVWDPSDFSASSKLESLYQQPKKREQLFQETHAVKALLKEPEAIEVDAKNGAQRAGSNVGWTEYGPLFDGNTWSKEKCKLVPTICGALKGDASLCASRSKQDDQIPCGSDTVVTVLRLRPGGVVEPSFGPTNVRLVMHFSLEGSEGVELKVGQETVKGEDGRALVFNDSFEHSVLKGGDTDLVLVVAVLKHPDQLYP